MDEYQDEFELILYAGNAKSKAMMAIQASRKQEFDKARQLLDEAQAELLKAHNVEKRVITKEAQGEFVSVGILMIHAQDHLNAAMISLEEANELLLLYKRITQLEKEVRS